MTTQLISWNVNGIRAAIKKGFLDFLAEQDPDILCLQEVKAEQEQAELVLPGYHIYWNSAEKKGYSGTALLTKIKPLQVQYGLGVGEHDQEGRLITAEFQSYYLVNVYTPNSKSGLERLPYRTESWDKAFRSYITELEKTKPVIFCGDLNVAHEEIDLANPKTNRKSAGFTAEERQSFSQHLGAGYIDSFRHFHKEPNRYSWWSYRAGARRRNVGWRIDYFCVSTRLASELVDADILDQVLGSDHCPVTLTLALP